MDRPTARARSTCEGQDSEWPTKPASAAWFSPRPPSVGANSITNASPDQVSILPHGTDKQSLNGRIDLVPSYNACEVSHRTLPGKGYPERGPAPIDMFRRWGDSLQAGLEPSAQHPTRRRDVARTSEAVSQPRLVRTFSTHSRGRWMNILYEDLYFGLSDSANEYNQRGDDFVKSYVDINSIVNSVVSGRRTLVFGPKGTGKSALAYYIEATGPDGEHLALVRDASTLPLADIPNLQTGQPQGVDRTVTAWKFLLLCNLLDLVQKDEACHVPNARELKRVTRLLKEFGFMGDASGKALLQVSTTTVSIPIPRAGSIYKRESSRSLNIFSLIPYLEDWATKATSLNRHVLILDGLDSIFLNDSRYDESLSSLVQASYLLNQLLSKSTSSGSIVLLLRNDVFSRISMRLPDSQKMRDDLGVELDWRVLSGAAGEKSPLIRLVNAKVSQDAGQTIRVLDYFPASIQVGKKGRWIPTLQYLLNLTRHTPRDLLRVFDEIRAVQAEGSFQSSGEVLSRQVIREGVLRYASRYFVNAIKNEFAGYDAGPQRAQEALLALQQLSVQTFTRESFYAQLNEVNPDTGKQTDELLRLLFYAGAIGNLVGTDSYLRFYHRRDDSTLYLRGSLILHGALCHAWNMPFSI